MFYQPAHGVRWGMCVCRVRWDTSVSINCEKINKIMSLHYQIFKNNIVMQNKIVKMENVKVQLL